MRARKRPKSGSVVVFGRPRSAAKTIGFLGCSIIILVIVMQAAAAASHVYRQRRLGYPSCKNHHPALPHHPPFSLSLHSPHIRGSTSLTRCRANLRMCTSGECNREDKAERARCTLQFLWGDEPLAIDRGKCLNFCGDGPNCKSKFPAKVFSGLRSTQDLLAMIKAVATQSSSPLGAFSSPTSRPLSSERTDVAEAQERGWAALHSHHYDEAIRCFTQALDTLELSGSNANDVAAATVDELKSRLLSARAKAHLAADDARQGLADADAAVDLFAGNAHAWQAKSEAHVVQGDDEMGKMARDVVTRINPVYYGNKR
uniref:Uncharacterized protein n=1 Tax=Lotharella oceanica TaxID=641309 RepID=A0A7S2U084_9EUKA|mmetsp:Transcript_36154/g.66796  ORF Transcript_36154/g.66796 Transcript_36154/m.66796 type:complete len:315 (+) Transcript_36154:108-1052(+)